MGPVAKEFRKYTLIFYKGARHYVKYPDESLDVILLSSTYRGKIYKNFGIVTARYIYGWVESGSF